ncbi:hypothetical protein V5799_015669 [Amblyomma americanum]|uniref:Peptidase M13 N-terminal domain-containing protein n=1 Tax=Amblyomma americanum TaxID=6943 RepID=A0AAQ4F774_AMBAM
MENIGHVKLLVLLALAATRSLQAAGEMQTEALLVKDYINDSEDPCSDFYAYTCGNWIEKNKRLDLYNYLGLLKALSLVEYASTSFPKPSPAPKLPRPKECVSLVFSAMKEVVSHLYAKHHVPLEAKREVEDIVTLIKAAFIEELQGADWMDNTTRATAKEKVGHMKFKITGLSINLLMTGSLNEYHLMTTVP